MSTPFSHQGKDSLHTYQHRRQLARSLGMIEQFTADIITPAIDQDSDISAQVSGHSYRIRTRQPLQVGITIIRKNERKH